MSLIFDPRAITAAYMMNPILYDNQTASQQTTTNTSINNNKLSPQNNNVINQQQQAFLAMAAAAQQSAAFNFLTTTSNNNNSTTKTETNELPINKTSPGASSAAGFRILDILENPLNANENNADADLQNSTAQQLLNAALQRLVTNGHNGNFYNYCKILNIFFPLKIFLNLFKVSFTFLILSFLLSLSLFLKRPFLIPSLLLLL